MIGYLSIIQMIKANPSGAFFYNCHKGEIKEKLMRLKKIGKVTISTGYDGNMRYGWVVKPTQSPEIAPPAVIDRVHVSFWQQGARKGKFSQEAYKVTDRPRDGFITIELMAGKPYTVKAEYTKAVA